MKNATIMAVAIATLGLHAPTAHAKDPLGFNPAGASSLKDIPVEVVVANDRLRVQMAWETISIDPQIAQNAMNGMPSMSTGAGIAASAAGGAIAGLIINASIKSAAKKQARAGAAVIDAAACDLPHGEALAAAAEQAVKGTPWGAQATIQRHVLAEGQKLETFVPNDKPRLTIALSYSLATDFATVMTTAEVQAFAPSIPGAPEHWQTEPVWSDHIVYVSDTIDVPAKSQAAIDKAVADENARYAQTGVDALIDKANKFDDTLARLKAVELMKEHERALRDARRKDWTFDETRLERARLWAENGCGRLRTVLDGNDAGMGQVLSQLFAGQLPAPDPHALLQGPLIARNQPKGDRRIVAFEKPSRLYVSRRDGENSYIGYRYAWYDDSAEKQKH
jgi:hypothetical protein